MQNELGELQKEFTGQNAADRSFLVSFALLVWGVIGIGLGIKDLVFSQNGGGFLAYLMVGCAPFFFLGCVWAYRQANWLRSISVQLYERGFLVTIKDQEPNYPFAWNRIARVEEMIIQKGRHRIWRVLVVRDDNESFQFGEHMFDDAQELRDTIQQQTAVLGIPWEIQDENSRGE